MSLPIGTLLLVASVLTSGTSSVAALYFPLSKVDMVVPVERSLVNKPVLKLQVLGDDNSVPKTRSVVYTINDTSMYDINPQTGELIMKEAMLTNPKKGADINTSLLVTAKWKTGEEDVTTVVTVRPKQFHQESYCDLKGMEEFCFWDNAEYAVYENATAAVLGSLGPGYIVQLCPRLNTSYSLLNGHNYASVEKIPTSVENSYRWVLKSKPGLDRDTMESAGRGPGPELKVLVSCNMTLESSVQLVTKTIRVQVNDQDDNLPAAQQSTYERDIWTKGHKLEQNEQLDFDDLLLIDPDSFPVNNYEVKIVDDPSHLLSVSHTKFIDDRQIPQTALHLKVHARDNAYLPVSPYNVTLRITDTSFVNVTNNQVNIVLRLHGSQKTLPPAVKPESASSLKLSKPLIKTRSDEERLYPSNITMFRGSGMYHRITQPFGGLAAVQGLSFTIQPYTNMSFNVTRDGGILYVSDVHKLVNGSSSITLVINIRNDTTGVSAQEEMYVELVEESEGPCNMFSHTLPDYHKEYCAEAENKKACVSKCGFTTGSAMETPPTHSMHVGCQWRLPAKFNYSAIKYMTCTPHSETCPDTVCDPLEHLDENICPQDCSNDTLLDAESHLRGRNDKILQGNMVCFCNPRCMCLPVEDKSIHKNKSSTTSTTTAPAALWRNMEQATGNPVAAKKATDGSRCGMDCLLALVTGSFVILIFVVSGFIYWRHRLLGKGRRDRKYGATSTSSVTGLQTTDYLERGLSTPEGQLITLDHNVTLQSSDPRTLPDPKWEYPRQKLVIEQTLGEGEFGRVLRARAVDIASIPGYTTVAVKTLKEGASAAELADLLSEYHLLKEVCHPNVIRLLGACTDPSGPVYVIIEFAEHGSLRTYLRRSRHIESECKSTLTSNNLLPFTEPEPFHKDIQRVLMSPITPRDILSFAWQISKGMAYLSDIKLVHRDLAARNILVATGKICKISDFGLTRDVYEDDAYLKRSKGRVPVKWMALESLSDHVYTSKSDVWSFGVLLWELVTLGASPYPGVAVHNLFHLLKAGYRMERPENCSVQLYRVMRNCWSEEPGERPAFWELVQLFERMLEDGIEYLDLNPRSVHNRTYFTSLPSPNDIMDVKDDDVRYGNIVIPPEPEQQQEQQESMTHMERIAEEVEEEEHRDFTPEDELRLLDNTSKDVSTDEICDKKNPQYQNELKVCEDTNYLSPIRQPKILNEGNNKQYVPMNRMKVDSEDWVSEDILTASKTGYIFNESPAKFLNHACEATHL